MASKKKKTPATEMPSGTCMRAIRLELVKPLTESWETAEDTMRAIAKAVPILGNAALDSMAAQRRIQELESAARPTGKRKPRRSEPQVSA